MTTHRDDVTGPSPLDPGTASYASAVSSWNLLVRHRPAAAFSAVSAEEVSAAVRYARRGGHGVAAMATGHGSLPVDTDGVLVNTAAMSHVRVDADRRTATVGAGARWADVHAASAPHGLVGVCGSSSAVGVVGYTQAGGFGWLSRRLGFASSSVRAAELVTADGDILSLDEDRHPDLLWGVAGGAGNFGVVTSLTVDLHRVGATGGAGPATVYGGNLYYPVDRAAEVATLYAGWAPMLPPEVMSALTVRRFPPLPDIPEPLRGQTVVAIRACGSGPSLASGEEAVQIARSALGVPTLDTFTRLPAHDLDRISLDPTMPVPAAQRGETLHDIDSEVIDVLVEHTLPHDGPPLVMLELRQLGGALDDAPRGPHPMARTRGGYSINAVHLVPDPDQEEAARAQQERLFDRLGSHLTGSTYLNFLDAGTADPTRVRAAYDEADWARLVDLKSDLDPHNRFRYGRTIPPRDPAPGAPAHSQHPSDTTHFNGAQS